MTKYPPPLFYKVLKNVLLFYCSGADTLLQQAREWESSGEYPRAVECYVKITNKVTQDTHILEKSWVKAGELSIKFLGHDRATSVVEIVGPRLTEIGKYAPVSSPFLSDFMSSSVYNDISFCLVEYNTELMVLRNRLGVGISNKGDFFLESCCNTH